MTDIVGSTALAAELGDGAWSELLQLHHALVRRALREHRGREIDTAGDGFFATFDAPAEAILCALAIGSRVREIGLEVRAGVHVGEVEQIAGKVGGVSVPIAARIMAAADPGQVLVSSTVRDLAAGSSFGFADRGTAQLRGIPGEWHLYAVGPETAADAGPRASARPTRAEDDAARRSAAVRRSRDRPVWERRPRMVAVTAIGLVAVVAVCGLLLVKPWQTPALPHIDPEAVGVIDIGRGEIVASTPLGDRPGGVAIGGGAAWITNTGADTITQVDMASRQTRRLIDVGQAPVGIAFADGSVWVADSAARTVTRVNATTGRPVGSITVGNGPTAITAAAGAVWVTSVGDSTVTRIDAATGEAGSPLPIAAGPVALAGDGSGIWVASADAAMVTHIEGSSGVTLAAPIALSARPTAITVGAEAVWVAGADGSVTRIDPETHQVTASSDVGGPISAIAASADGIWIADREGSVAQLDPEDPARVLRRIRTSSAPEALVVGEGEIWVVTRASVTSHRGGTLRVATTVLPGADPGIGGGSIGQFVADGLVAYRRVGGVTGTVLLPDLAVAVPRPANGGRTYTFQLRPGLAYSTGEQVRPADFRRAIERSFQVANPGTGIAEGNWFFTSIVGVEACATADAEPVERCDLGAGISTDDRTGTITFRLSDPDPTFLHALASSLAYPVPEGVPMHGPIDRPFPGTGPYVEAERTATDVRLVRNPLFTAWDPEVRPDGLPDEIAWTAVDSVSTAAAVVERGEADLVALRDDDRLPPDLFARLYGRYPGQLHVAPAVLTAAHFNTALAPFDDPTVRQAVNLAIDRGRIVEARGGPLAAAATCQVLLSGWPGYRPYCPYTADPDPGGRWLSPDLEAARRLVDASGTRGTVVVVGPVIERFAAERDALVTTLRDLGYEATADLETDFEKVWAATIDEGRVQLGIWEWYPGSLTPGDYLDGFTCAASAGLTNACDPELEELIAAANALQGADPAAAADLWALADRRIVDLAVFAPLYASGTDFVSARVGNYQFHPGYEALLDQLWVQ